MNIDKDAGRVAIESTKLFSILKFRDCLVKHGVVFMEAIEDAENFDGGRTLSATQAAYDELNDPHNP